MGDCTSRPSPTEIEEHINESNSKNDKYFKIIPFAEDQHRLITSETSPNVLELRKYLFDKKYKEYNKKSESATQGSSAIKEFIVEIQKAVELSQNGFCFNQGKPYVTVTLEPNGPTQETFAADRLKPKWYKLMQFKTLMNFQAIRFLVKVQGSNKVLGDFVIKVKELKNQRVMHQWFHLGEGTKEALMVRVQYIFDEAKLYRELEKKCLDYIDEIDSALRSLSSLVL